MPGENVLFENKLCKHVILHSIYDYCKIALILHIAGIVCHMISHTVTKSYKIGPTIRSKFRDNRSSS